MCCDCQESMKLDVETEMQVMVLFALLHLKITNVSLRQKVKTKNNYEFFDCAILWKHLLCPSHLGPQRL